MKLFLSIEAQNATEIEIDKILRYVNEKLSFLTNSLLSIEDDFYGTEYNSIGIIPVCMESSIIECLGWKERVKISRKNKDADVRLFINYENFIKESYNKKCIIFIATIVKSIQMLQAKSKGDFKGEELIKDIISAFEMTPEQNELLKTYLDL